MYLSVRDPKHFQVLQVPDEAREFTQWVNIKNQLLQVLLHGRRVVKVIGNSRNPVINSSKYSKQ